MVGVRAPGNRPGCGANRPARLCSLARLDLWKKTWATQRHRAGKGGGWILLLWQRLWPKSTWGGEDIFHLTTVEVRAGTETEAMEGCCLLACSSLFSYSSTQGRNRGDSTHSELGPPTPVINQGHPSSTTDLDTGQFGGGIFSLRFPFSK